MYGNDPISVLWAVSQALIARLFLHVSGECKACRQRYHARQFRLSIGFCDRVLSETACKMICAKQRK